MTMIIFIKNNSIGKNHRIDHNVSAKKICFVLNYSS